MSNNKDQKIVQSGDQRLIRYSSNLIKRGLSLADQVKSSDGNSSQHLQEPKTQMKAEEFFRQGVDKASQGDYQGALEDYSQVLWIDPSNAYAYIYRSVARSHLGDKQGAIEDCTQVLKINPTYAEVYKDRGLIRAELGDHSGAIEDYTQALRINPNLLAAYFNRGYLYSRLGNYSGAIEDYNQGLQINPNFVEAYILRGSINLKLEKYSDALEDFEQAMQIDPDSPQVYIKEMNDAFQKQGTEETIQLLAQSLIMQGNVRYESGDYQGAAKAYTQVLSLDPNNAEAYNRRSTARSALGDYQGAMEDLQKARTPSLVKETGCQFLDYLRLLSQITR